MDKSKTSSTTKSLPKKSKKEEVSTTESESSSEDSSKLLPIRQIKREVKTPQRSLTPRSNSKQLYKVEYPRIKPEYGKIKREHKSPKQEISSSYSEDEWKVNKTEENNSSSEGEIPTSSKLLKEKKSTSEESSSESSDTEVTKRTSFGSSKNYHRVESSHQKVGSYSEMNNGKNKLKRKMEIRHKQLEPEFKQSNYKSSSDSEPQEKFKKRKLQTKHKEESLKGTSSSDSESKEKIKLLLNKGTKRPQQNENIDSSNSSSSQEEESLLNKNEIIQTKQKEKVHVQVDYKPQKERKLLLNKRSIETKQEIYSSDSSSYEEKKLSIRKDFKEDSESESISGSDDEKPVIKSLPSKLESREQKVHKEELKSKRMSSSSVNPLEQRDCLKPKSKSKTGIDKSSPQKRKSSKNRLPGDSTTSLNRNTSEQLEENSLIYSGITEDNAGDSQISQTFIKLPRSGSLPNTPVNTDSKSFEEDETISRIENNIRNQLEEEKKARQIESSPKNVKDLLKTLFPNLKLLQLKFDPALLKTESSHILRIPKSVVPSSLLNKELDLYESSKLKIGREKYIIESSDKILDPALVVGADSKIVHFGKNMFMKKRLKRNKIPDLKVLEKCSVPLPENLKKRHPLFGSNFEDKINLSKLVEEKLDEAIASVLKQQQKIKSKKKKKRKVEQEEEIFDSLKAHTSAKNVKKDEVYDSAYSSASSKEFRQSVIEETMTKIKQELNVTDYENEIESQSPRKGKKNKKEKFKKDEDEEEILRHVKQEMATECSFEDVGSEYIKKKKKSKKSKRSTREGNESEEEVGKHIIFDSSSKKQKRKMWEYSLGDEKCSVGNKSNSTFSAPKTLEKLSSDSASKNFDRDVIKKVKKKRKHHFTED